MKSNSSSGPLLLLLVGILALAAVFVGLMKGGPGRESIEAAGTPSEAPAAPAAQLPDEALLVIPELSRPARPTQSGPSTVLWPLKVELKMLSADYLPSAAGVVAVGSGASALLTGNISNSRDQGTPATVRFVAGTNEGRVLETNTNGDFGADNLYPGISIVEISGPGIVGSRRELRLRAGHPEVLNISYQRPGIVVGWIKNTKGEPIPGVKVRVDGIPSFTDLDGGFSATNVAGGLNVMLEMEHPDYVSKYSVIRVASGQRTFDEGMIFTMEEGARLQLVVSNDIGGPGPVEVYLLPGPQQRAVLGGTSYRTERYPFHSLNPIKVNAGGIKEVRGLPSGSVAAYAFRLGAKAKMGFVNLRPGQESVHKIRLEDSQPIRGRLTQEGKPAVGLEVCLEAPDRVRATLAFLTQRLGYLESCVVPTFPAAAQSTYTDAKGEFSFTEWERESATRFISARGADGETYAGRFVRPGERDVQLELRPIEAGDAELALEFLGRFQSLPVEVSLNNRPLDPVMIAPDEDLIIEELLAGRWSLKISWHSIEVLPEQTLRIEGSTQRSITLIPEAIEGQDEEAWSRAGREYPLAAQ